MNEQYKEAVKEVGPNDNSRFSKGDRVRHWFAGKGTVVGLEGEKTVDVRWDDNDRKNGKSGCWAKHLYRVQN